MVGQACKGLNADDIGHTGRNQLDHLSRQEPPFAILVAQGQIGLGHLRDFFNGYRRIKALALAQSINGRAAQSPHHLDAHFGRKLRAPARPQEFMAVFTAQQTIVEKVQHIRHHGLGPLGLQNFNQVVIGQGHILDQDLADHAHPGLAEGLVNGQAVKSLDNTPANPAIGIGGVLIHQRLNADFFPLPVQLLGRAGDLLIGPHPIQAAHEQVAIDQGVHRINGQPCRDLKARIFLHAVGIDGDHGDIWVARLLQGTADKGHIVAGPAAAAGLGHHDGQMIRIVFTGEHCLHDLPHHGNGGETGVVIDIFQPRIDGRPVVIVQDHHMIAVLFKNRLQNLKVDGAHLGRQNGIALQLHGFRVLHTLEVHRPGAGMNLLLPAHLHGRNQAADADADSAQIVHLVDFQQRIEFIAALQDLIDLVRGHSVQTAAKGIELQQLQVIPIPDEPGGGIQPGMVDPLVHDPQVLVFLGIREAVLREHRQAIGGDELGDTVIDLRVDMIGPPGQDNTAAAIVLHLLQYPLSFRHDVGLGLPLLRPGCLDCRLDFGSRDVPFLLTELYQPFGSNLFIGKGHKGADIAHFPLCNSLHVVFQVFRIGGHHGAAVVVLSILVLLVFIKHTGVENGGDSLVYEPLHMAVGQLGGIALGF